MTKKTKQLLIRGVLISSFYLFMHAIGMCVVNRLDSLNVLIYLTVLPLVTAVIYYNSTFRIPKKRVKKQIQSLINENSGSDVLLIDMATSNYPQQQHGILKLTDNEIVFKPVEEGKEINIDLTLIKKIKTTSYLITGVPALKIYTRYNKYYFSLDSAETWKDQLANVQLAV